MFIDMAKIPATDLAYAAGLLDGDGCVSVSKTPMQKRSKNQSFMVTVRISQKLEEIPLWLLAAFGGRIRTMGKHKATKRFDGSEVKFIPMFAWELYCQDAACFLEAIGPYLKMKQHRAHLAIDLARRHNRKGTKKGMQGLIALSEEEMAERTRLAVAIRAENQRGNDRVAMTSKWGIN